MATVVMNPLLASELLREPGVGEVLLSVAERIVEHAKANPLPRGGENYRQCFGAELELSETGYRAIAYNTDFTAGWVEFGAHAGGVTPVLGYHVMAQAVDQAVDENV